VEVAILIVIALVVAAFGIRLGMLLAPRVERLADRADPTDPATELPPEQTPDADAEPPHEDDDDRTD
jgi:hypothetical protein